VGYRREHDRLPRRFHEPLPRGKSANRPIPEREFQEEIDEYYRLRGWDEKGPTPEKLRGLGLGELAPLREDN